MGMPLKSREGKACSLDSIACYIGRSAMQTATITEPAVKEVSYLDPTGHVHTEIRRLTPRLGDIKGTVAGIMDNGNDTSRFFFLSLAETLEKDHGVTKVIMKSKPAASKAATDGMLDDMAKEADFVVAGVAL